LLKQQINRVGQEQLSVVQKSKSFSAIIAIAIYIKRENLCFEKGGGSM